jgi:hypothetical protein
LDFIEIFQPKKRQKLAFSVEFFQKTEHREKKRPLQKMFTSTSSIYGKIFRLLAFVIEELDKIQFDWEALSCPPIWTPLHGLQFFSNLQLCLQVQVLQALKVSFHSDEVNVNSGTLSKESPLIL